MWQMARVGKQRTSILLKPVLEALEAIFRAGTKDMSSRVEIWPYLNQTDPEASRKA